MLSQFLSRKPLGAAFLHAAPCAFMFALYTDLVREGNGIAYRNSRNLAKDHGLVFSSGSNGSMAKDWLFWSKPEIK